MCFCHICYAACLPIFGAKSLSFNTRIMAYSKQGELLFLPDKCVFIAPALLPHSNKRPVKFTGRLFAPQTLFLTQGFKQFNQIVIWVEHKCDGACAMRHLLGWRFDAHTRLF